MYLEHFHLTHSPFREEPDPEVFFPGAKREEVCQSLVLDILAGKPLIKLIGREGSGKTLLCRLIMDRLPDDFEVVYIDNPAGAFDDLLRIACLDLGMNPSGVHEATNFLQELHALLEQRRIARKKVVILIDEAEKLFLATLERFVRHIVESMPDFSLTILLSGRPGLEANLEQLAAFCSHLDNTSGYFLTPLTENETRQYLRFRLYAAGLSREQHEDIFTEGAVAKIFDTAQGNLRMINILAEESLQVSYSEKSFMVLLDHVDPDSADHDGVENRVIEIYDLLRQNKLVTGILASAVIVVLTLGFLLSGQGEKAGLPAPGSQKPIEVVAPPPPPHPPAQAAPASPSTSDPVAQTAAVPPQAVSASQEPVAPPPGTIQLPAQQPVPPAEPQPAAASKESPPPAAVVSPATPQPAATSAPAKQEQTALTPEQQKLQAALNKDEEHRDGEKIFRDRRGASASWLAGAYRNGYTIQLMALASEQAQASITKMLVQDEYFPFRDQFFILRKKGPPQTFFVFFGIYASMDAARDARNSMPVFLRKHHPYPLSIAEALKKTEN